MIDKLPRCLHTCLHCAHAVILEEYSVYSRKLVFDGCWKFNHIRLPVDRGDCERFKESEERVKRSFWKKWRFNLERNIDIEDSNPRKKYVHSTTISEQGRFIRQYLKKIDSKIVIRTEVSAGGEFDDVTLQLEEELEKEELWCKMRSLQRERKSLLWMRSQRKQNVTILGFS